MEIPRPPETQMPYGDADCTLRALAARAEGFGCHAIGGLHGALYYVTSLQGFRLPIDQIVFIFLLFVRN